MAYEGPEVKKGCPWGYRHQINIADIVKRAIEKMRAAFPNIKALAATVREVENMNLHKWGAALWENGNWYIIEPKPVHVLDRIGGGDGFVGIMLYAILKGWEPEKWVQFDWTNGALATTFSTDYSQPSDEEMVWDVWRGNARVNR